MAACKTGEHRISRASVHIYTDNIVGGPLSGKVLGMPNSNRVVISVMLIVVLTIGVAEGMVIGVAEGLAISVTEGPAICVPVGLAI